MRSDQRHRGRVGADHGAEGSTEPIGVLLIDDDEPWTRTQRRTLERTGEEITTRTAGGLADARRHLRDGVPDCIVCDYRLGDGTGLELLAEVRGEYGSIPFVLVTGQGDERVASDAIAAHVTDYVRKSDVAADPSLLASRIASVVAADRTERDLHRERRSKEALLEMLTAGSDRQALGRRACDHLVNEHGYAAAWVGVPDGNDGLVPLAAAGAIETLNAANPGTRDGDDPALRAFAGEDAPIIERLDPTADTDDVNDANLADDANVADDGTNASDGWRGFAARHGFEAVAAVPLRHGDVRFGALTVYGSAASIARTDGVDLLTEYANAVAFGLRTETWRETLLSTADRRVEVSVGNVAVPLVAVSTTLPRTAVMEVSAVVVRDDGRILYVTRIEGASTAAVDAALNGVDAVRSVDEYGCADGIRRGIIVEGGTPEATAVDAGARFERTVIKDGRARVSLLVGLDDDIAGVTGAIAERFGDVSVASLGANTPPGPDRVTDPMADLTDRQREVLEVAFAAGYFERPRRTNTEELADALGISRSTVTQHLRAAERKLFGSLLADE